MALIDLSDSELAEQRAAILAEQIRRENLAAIPVEIARLTAEYTEAGGSQKALETAILPNSSDEPAVVPAEEAP